MRRWVLLALVLLLAAGAVGVLLRPSDGAGSSGGERDAANGEGGDGPGDVVHAAPRLKGRESPVGAEAGAAAAAAAAASGGRAHHTIRGRVVDDDDGEPLSGVRVRLGRSPPPVPGVTEESETWFRTEPITTFVAERATDAEGGFLLEIEGLRGWALLLTKEGYSEAAYGTGDWPAPDEEPLVDWEIALRRASPIRVQVVDEGDRPVRGARVAKYHELESSPPAAVVFTDEKGCFELMAAGDDQLVITAEGFARHVEEDVPQRTHAPIVLTRAHVLAGVVVDEMGTPQAGAAVWTDENTVTPIVTGEAGRFRWNDVPLRRGHEEIGLYARRDGYVDGYAHVVPGRDDVRLVLTRSGTLSGRVVFPAGGDPQHMDLRVEGRGNWRKVLRVTNGTFHIEDVPSGDLHLSATVRRVIEVHGKPYAVLALSGENVVERTPHQDLAGVTVPLEVLPLSFAVLRVVDPEGNPLAGAWHYVECPYGGAHLKRSTAEGLSWSARNVPPGTHTSAHARLIVRIPNGSQTVRSDPVALRTAADLEAEPVEVVIDPDPGQHSSRATLVLTMEREDGLALAPDVGANWLVSHGGYLGFGRNPDVTPPTAAGVRWRGVLPVEAGVRLNVLAWARGCASRRFLLPPCTAGDTVEFTCRLAPESRIRGRLVTQIGRPASWYKIHARVHRVGGPAVERTRWPHDSERDGTFRLTGVPAGRAYVSVERPDGGIVAQVECQVPEAATVDLGDIVVGALPALRGVVRDAGGHPLGGALIELLESGESAAYAHAASGPDGWFACPGALRAGAAMRVARDDLAPLYVRLAPELTEEVLTIHLVPRGTLVVESPALPSEIATWWLSPLEGICGRRLGSVGRGEDVPGGHRWSLASLPIGHVRLELIGRRHDGSRWTRELEAEVVSGKTTTARFEREE